MKLQAISHKLPPRLQKCTQSIWFFPIILLIPLLLMTALKINGSSIGIYHNYFYGNTKDTALLFNKPLAIRSDEWMVNSQMTMAQEKTDYQRVNSNLGDGQDMSVSFDAPYKDWSVIFKPHQLVFFVLPFEYAFAFRWWLIAYLLIISCYFFVLALLPKRKLLASLASLAFFFSPFVHWWYLYGTLGTLFFSLFIATIVIKLLHTNSKRQALAWTAALTYCLTCFVFILYPPFQLPSILALVGFSIGYLIEVARKENWPITFKRLLFPVSATVIALGLTGLFVITRIDIIKTIQNTAYPGKRVQKSGGYNLTHLMSSQTGAAMQSKARADKYMIPTVGLTNQSENSNFFQLIPLLLLPTLVVLWAGRKNREIFDWPLATTTATYSFFLIWLFLPGISFLGKLTLLSNVPHQRLLIGLGLLQFIFWILLIRNFSTQKKPFTSKQVILFTTIALAIQLFFNLRTNSLLPGFISVKWAVLLALPLSIVVFLTLKRKFELAAATLALFAFLSVFRTNPLYRGVSILRQTPVSQAVESINRQQTGRWVSDIPELKNLLLIDGVRSLSGVYGYPQIELWEGVDPTASNTVYNRYAHVQFNFDRDPAITANNKLSLASDDNMGVLTEPCSSFLSEQRVTYILTSVRFKTAGDTCLEEIKEINYPAIDFYIYKRSF